MTLPYKIDPVPEFLGNNLSFYFYPFNTLVFRLNPCRIRDQESSFLNFNLTRSTPLFLGGDLRCKPEVLSSFALNL